MKNLNFKFFINKKMSAKKRYVLYILRLQGISVNSTRKNGVTTDWRRLLLWFLWIVVGFRVDFPSDVPFQEAFEAMADAALPQEEQNEDDISLELKKRGKLLGNDDNFLKIIQNNPFQEFFCRKMESWSAPISRVLSYGSYVG